MKGFIPENLTFSTSTEHYEDGEFPLTWFDNSEGNEKIRRTRNFDEFMDLLEEIDTEIIINDLTEYV
jgi:hypothetical protein